MEPRRLLHRAEGQAIVLVALAMVVLVAAAGLGLDGANAFKQRRNANNAADAAALAATRALIAENKSSTNGNAINSAISDYLADHLGAIGGSYTWEAFYVSRQGQLLPEGAPERTDQISSVPSDARGVLVKVVYTFNTFFMPILSRETLTVWGQGMALYGPSGETIGPDLIPLAIDQSATQSVMNSGGSDFNINLFGATAGTYLVEPGNFGKVSLDPGGSNNTGTNADCTSSAVVDSFSYWWCQGSPYKIKIGMDLPGKPGTLSSSLEDEIQWRIDNHPIALLPVFAYTSKSGGNTQYHVVGFLAVKLLSLEVTGMNGERSVRAEYVNYYTAPGAIVGDGNGVDTGTYAINLVR